MMTPLETQVWSVIAMFQGAIPSEQLEDMSELAQAGEPGVALENLCTQLHEYDILVSEDAMSQIETLVGAMDLDLEYCRRLKRG